MNFLNPIWLWSLLAVAVPVAIHFWHQQRGKPLPWAATRWLTDTRQQRRGLRLEQWLLLLLRCLIVSVLAFLLAQPLRKAQPESNPNQTVHLVEPNARVVDNFRFELTHALQRKERVLWAADGTPAADESLRFAETPKPLHPLQLQTALNTFIGKPVRLHLYVQNRAEMAAIPNYAVPTLFALHTISDSTQTPTNKKPTYTKPIRVGLSYQNPNERQTVRAALLALADVYRFDFQIDDSIQIQNPDWLFTDRLPIRLLPQTQYVVSGMPQTPTPPNVTFTGETLTPATSERVATGQLPEWLGQLLLQTYGLTPAAPALSARSWQQLFLPADAAHAAPDSTTAQSVLLLLLIVLLTLERGLALYRNA